MTTFDEFKGKEVVNTQTNQEDTQLTMTKNLMDSPIDEHFINLLLFQAQLRIMHWGTESYAEHNAYGATYDSISGTLDALVESYQGYHKRIDFGSACELISFSNVETNSWLESMLECMKKLRNECSESDLQNLTDELISHTSKLKYLLTLK